MNSLISNEKKCYVCGTRMDLHKHHIYMGVANRKKSDEWGCWVYLCGKHHNLSSQGIHFNKELDKVMKKMCQEKFEDKYDHETFMKVFRKNYL